MSCTGTVTTIEEAQALVASFTLLAQYQAVRATMTYLTQEYQDDARALRAALDARECQFKDSMRVEQAKLAAIRATLAGQPAQTDVRPPTEEAPATL